MASDTLIGAAAEAASVRICSPDSATSMGVPGLTDTDQSFSGQAVISSAKVGMTKPVVPTAAFIQSKEVKARTDGRPWTGTADHGNSASPGRVCTAGGVRLQTGRNTVVSSRTLTTISGSLRTSNI